MKKMITILVLLVSVVANAGDEYVPQAARKNFEKEFPSAVYAKWEKVAYSELYQVRFVYNDQSLLAFVHSDGTVMATARNIGKEGLPFMVNETIAKKFSDFSIIQIEELSTATEVSYFFTLENKHVKKYLRVFNNGNFNELKKEKKKIAPAIVAH